MKHIIMDDVNLINGIINIFIKHTDRIDDYKSWAADFILNY